MEGLLAHDPPECITDTAVEVPLGTEEADSLYGSYVCLSL